MRSPAVGSVALALMASVWAVAAQARVGPAARVRTVWDGVYTEEQAKRGEAIYAARCERCHGAALLGEGEATALTGPGFAANWEGVSMGELADRTRNTMPNDQPGTLSRQQVADVLAFVLRFDKFPAGDAELPVQAEALNQIRFVATKPSASAGEE